MKRLMKNPVLLEGEHVHGFFFVTIRQSSELFSLTSTREIIILR